MSNATTRTVKGVLGEKLGMTQVWDADNRLVPVTVIKVGPNAVSYTHLDVYKRQVHGIHRGVGLAVRLRRVELPHGSAPGRRGRALLAPGARGRHDGRPGVPRRAARSAGPRGRGAARRGGRCDDPAAPTGRGRTRQSMRRVTVDPRRFGCSPRHLAH